MPPMSPTCIGRGYGRILETECRSSAMPFSIRFRKPVDVTEAEPYINDCCIGGDVVLGHLLPALRQTYGDLEPTQEDWGWFVWFEHVGVKLAVDVFTQDPLTNEFEIHLTSRKA